MFFVAAAKLVLDFYGNDEVTEKRAQLKLLIKNVRKEFNVSISEVEDFDDPERCVLGLSLCAAERDEARAKLTQVAKHIDETSFARVVTEEIDVLGF